MGDALGVGGVVGGVGAGHLEVALEGPGEEWVGTGGGGPGEVVGAEEPEGVEGGAGGLEWAHDLDGGVAGLGREEGGLGDALEGGECFGEGGLGGLGVEVERGEFVEGGFPFAEGLEFGAVEMGGRGPAGGFEELVEEGGPVGVGVWFGEVVFSEGSCEEVEVFEKRGEVRGVAGAGGEAVELREGQFRLEEMLAAEDEGVELGAGEGFGGGAAGGGEVRREEKGGDAVDGERGDGPAEDVEGGGGERGVGQGDAEGELVGGEGGAGDVVEFGGKDGAEDAVDLGADGVDGWEDDGYA